MGEASSTVLDSLYWVDDANIHDSGTFYLSKSVAQVPLTRLVRKYLGADDPRSATGTIVRLAYLPILSNNIEGAQELLTALFNLASDYINGKTADLKQINVSWQMHAVLTHSAKAASTSNWSKTLVTGLSGVWRAMESVMKLRCQRTCMYGARQKMRAR